MAEEPRRSGRSTKGVNPKNQEEPEPPAPKPKKSTTKTPKSQTDSAAPAEAEEGEGAGDVIRCICGSDDDDGREFVSCDKCDVWQHNECMGLPNDPAQVDPFLKERFNSEKYFCEQCKPQNHKELLAAIKRGERPWEEAAKQRKQKGKKGGRTSKANGTPEVKPPPKKASPAQPAQDVSQPARMEKGKRKHATETDVDGDAQPAKLRKSSGASTADATVQPQRRKSATVASPTSQSPLSQPPIAPPQDQKPTVARQIAELDNDQRKKIATFLQGKFESAIKELEKQGTYILPSGHTISSIAESQAVGVEFALFKNYVGFGAKSDFTPTYRTQMQAIGSNIVQNPTLMLRLLSQSITPDQLSKMTSDDMASEELQKQMASMKEEAEKQAMLVNDNSNKPLVRRTHKGEEVVEDQSNHMANESITSVPQPRRRESNMDGPESPAMDHSMADGGFSAGSPRRFDRPLTVDTSRSPNSGDPTRRSSNFDMNNVWSSVKSPDAEQSPRAANNHSRTYSWSASRAPPPLGQSSGKPVNEQHEAEIDRLLEDDDNDSVPYSPQEYVESSAIWKGWVDMPIPGGSVARFEAESHHVAGTDLQNKVHTLASIYPVNLEISGRIAKDRAELYLTSLSASRSTDVTVHSLRPTNPDRAKGQAEFDKLFKYFTNRSRYGVVDDSLHRPNVSDVYLIPLEAGEQTLPSFLDRLEHNTVESPVPRPLLLVVFILKWKGGAAPPTPATMTAPDATPAVPTPPMAIGGGYHNSTAPPVASAGTPSQHQPTMTLPHQTVNPNPYPPAQYPHAPPQQQATMPNAPAPDMYHKNMEAAKHILGDLAHCSTAQQILTAQREPVARDVLENLRLIFERDPRSIDDFSVFQHELSTPKT